MTKPAATNLPHSVERLGFSFKDLSFLDSFTSHRNLDHTFLPNFLCISAFVFLLIENLQNISRRKG